MYWESALSSAIEVGIAIAGFSGIVVVLGRRGQGQWSELERVRLRALLGSSVASVFFAFLPFVLLSAGLDEGITWRLGSAAFGFALAAVGFVRHRQFRGASAAGARAETVSFVIVGSTSVLLLLNAAWLGVAWPYLVGVLGGLAIAIGQFVRLLMDFRKDGTPGDRSGRDNT